MTYISKDLLSKVLITYVTLISAQSLKYCDKIREDNTKGKSDLEKMYSIKLITEYVKDLISKLEVSLKSQNKKTPVSEEFIDFDDFFEETYHSLLSDDIKVRLSLEEFSTNKLNKT